ncbi:MAG: glucosaminidase domain-containing protein [Tissierellia bacterium]|nr:glucosaminidase domain-containing protein [Tissierellia bacterium]
MKILILALSIFCVTEQYDVDPFFAKAVAVLESGWNHDSAMAKRDNNLFGLMGKRFKRPQESVEYFCKLMNGPLYKGKTIEEIGKIYCPPNSQKWAEKVRAIMKKLKKEGWSCTGDTEEVNIEIEKRRCLALPLTAPWRPKGICNLKQWSRWVQ